MPDYQKSKIYKIISSNTNKYYIGSTTQKLCNRKSGHINSYNQFKNGNRDRRITSFDLLELGDIDIILIENYPCNNKEELLKREREILEEHIKNNKDLIVNISIPTRKFKEWYNSKPKEYIDKRNEKRRKENTDKEKYEKRLINKRNNAGVKVLCEICNKEMRKDQLGKHKKSKRHINKLPR